MQSLYRSSIVVLTLFFLCLSLATAQAVTITARPTSANTGQLITFSIASSYSYPAPTPGCIMQIDYGDGSGWLDAPPPCLSTTCTTTARHAYASPGRYTVQTRLSPASFYDCSVLITQPASASTTVTIMNQDIDLPEGVVGMDYEYELGDRTNRYKLISGRMDTGLKIIFNQIKGVPDREGKYRFQIRETDPRGNTIDTWYNLKITKALLSVIPDPKEITMDRNRTGRYKITYTLKSSEPLSDTITSAKGVFLAGNRTLGVVATPLNTKMAQGQAKVSEQVTIPLAVIKTAQRLGIDKIRYQRTFNAQYMDAATTCSTAITVRTGFTITRIRITFIDHTAKRFVKRNDKIEGARVELSYEGAGMLKGYWQVDNRILARITKNLPFASSKTITLLYPKVPPLPTHSIGSHRLRFVVTNPQMDISFPQIIYIVTGEELSKTHPIHLVTPDDSSVFGKQDLIFTWKSRSEVVSYRIDILAQENGKNRIIFSGFSKKPSYTIPDKVSKKKFSHHGTWSWRVIGLDQNNRAIAASELRSFTLTVSKPKVNQKDRKNFPRMSEPPNGLDILK